MCGICGITGPDWRHDASAVVRSMTDALRHRGPDDHAVWCDPQGRAALGHARLSIIDLEGGAQPMYSADGRYAIVFNGEIYNFQSLQKELQNCGRTFQTRSDTEVLLQAYLEWGFDALDRLDGMFAFAIFDSHEGTLLAARDRVGIKPLYYHWNGQSFAFASEMKALLGLPGMLRRLDYRALVDYFVLGYPMAPATFFADLRELPPGHWIRIRQGKLEEGVFWKWRRDEQAAWSEAYSLKAAKDTLIKTLEEHIVADVPIGALLSGGIDSSLLVALLAKELGVRVETFTVAFGERRYDESSYARIVAEHLGLVHREVPVASGSIGDLDQIHAVLDQFDQPFADSSAIPTYLICRELRKHVKVAIGGDGGDETFGGYPRFRYADLANRFGRLPFPVLHAAELARRGLGSLSPGLSRQMGKIFRAARHRDERRLFDLLAYHDPSAISDLLTRDALDRAENYRPRMPRDGSGHPPDGRDMIDVTMQVTLPGDYLRKVDAMSGAHGLEIRVPFLGARVLDFAARLPHRWKYPRRGQNKMLLRRMLREYLPAEISARGKSGFGIPLDTSLSVENRAAVESMLTAGDARIRSLVDPQYTRTITRAFVTGEWPKAKWSRFAVYQNVYMLWSLERWLRKWNPSL